MDPHAQVSAHKTLVAFGNIIFCRLYDMSAQKTHPKWTASQERQIILLETSQRPRKFRWGFLPDLRRANCCATILNGNRWSTCMPTRISSPQHRLHNAHNHKHAALTPFLIVDDPHDCRCCPFELLQTTVLIDVVPHLLLPSAQIRSAFENTNELSRPARKMTSLIAAVNSDFMHGRCSGGSTSSD